MKDTPFMRMVAEFIIIATCNILFNNFSGFKIVDNISKSYRSLITVSVECDLEHQ